MSKILVVSDSHGDLDLLDKIAQQHQDIDYYLHLGDSELPTYLIRPFIGVRGNCDYDYDYPLTRFIFVNNIKIYLEHGLSLSSKDDEYYLSKDCKIFLHGHTHVHYVKKLKDMYIANPGSLTRPRDNSNGTYLIIDVKNEDSISFNFYELD